MSDEAVLEVIRGGDGDAQDYLLNKYKPFVRAKSRAYFLAGADRDDIIQEGMIGLYKAMKDYRSDKAAGFRSFAELCVTRQILTAVKMAARQKHRPLNTYISLHTPLAGDASHVSVSDTIPAPAADNPEATLINREDKQGMEAYIGASLSAFECRVLSRYLRGDSYACIAANELCLPKSVDNALQRVRRKIEGVRYKPKV